MIFYGFICRDAMDAGRKSNQCPDRRRENCNRQFSEQKRLLSVSIKRASTALFDNGKACGGATTAGLSCRKIRKTD